MKATCVFETPVRTYQTTRCHNPDAYNTICYRFGALSHRSGPSGCWRRALTGWQTRKNMFVCVCVCVCVWRQNWPSAAGTTLTKLARNLKTAVYQRLYNGTIMRLLNPLNPSGQNMYRTVVTICTAQWSQYVTHSGHNMYCTVVTICMYRTVVTICMYCTVVTICTA